MSDPSPDDLLTVREVATHMRVLEKTVREWISQGRLPASKAGKAWLIRRSDMQALVGGVKPVTSNNSVPDGPFRETGSRVFRPARAGVDP
jgi:excisionase family DNA binding protein